MIHEYNPIFLKIHICVNIKKCKCKYIYIHIYIDITFHFLLYLLNEIIFPAFFWFYLYFYRLLNARSKGGQCFQSRLYMRLKMTSPPHSKRDTIVRSNVTFRVRHTQIFENFVMNFINEINILINLFLLYSITYFGKNIWR